MSVSPQPDSQAIRVRRARPEDDARVGELLVEAFVIGYGRKMPEVVVTEARKQDLRDVASKRDTACVLVLEKDGEVVGTATLFPPGHPRSQACRADAADLRYVALDARLHGAGLSRPLLAEAESVARSWGAAAISLHVRRGAFGVARLYEKHGYRRAPEGDLDRLPQIYLEAYLLPLGQSSPMASNGESQVFRG